jgi:hypothetical protein
MNSQSVQDSSRQCQYATDRLVTVGDSLISYVVCSTRSKDDDGWPLARMALSLSAIRDLCHTDPSRQNAAVSCVSINDKPVLSSSSSQACHITSAGADDCCLLIDWRPTRSGSGVSSHIANAVDPHFEWYPVRDNEKGKSASPSLTRN